MHRHAVYLVEPTGFLGEQFGKPAPILGDRRRIVTAPRSQIQTTWQSPRDSPCPLTDTAHPQGNPRTNGIGEWLPHRKQRQRHTAPGSLKECVAPSIASPKSIPAASSSARESSGQGEVQTRLRWSCG